MRDKTEHDGETTQLTALADPDLEAFVEMPSLAAQRAARRFRRGLARDLQRPARKDGAA